MGFQAAAASRDLQRILATPQAAAWAGVGQQSVDPLVQFPNALLVDCATLEEKFLTFYPFAALAAQTGLAHLIAFTHYNMLTGSAAGTAFWVPTKLGKLTVVSGSVAGMHGTANSLVVATEYFCGLIGAGVGDWYDTSKVEISSDPDNTTPGCIRMSGVGFDRIGIFPEAVTASSTYNALFHRFNGAVTRIRSGAVR